MHESKPSESSIINSHLEYDGLLVFQKQLDAEPVGVIETRKEEYFPDVFVAYCILHEP